jgi:Bardet-Biedl syndrome 5 protein
MPRDRKSTTPAKGITKAFSFWQDREIRFDSPLSVLQLRDNTEHVYATFKNVEDTKGNNGYSGVLLVTNLRLLWWSSQRSSLNLSIGYYCIQKMWVQETESKLAGGTTESLTISSKYGASRFQFLFSVVHASASAAGTRAGRSASPGSTDGGHRNLVTQAEGSAWRSSQLQKDNAAQQRLYATVHAVWSAYESTRVYREVRVRGAVVQNSNVVLLRGEQVISRSAGVTNVSKEEGILGTFVVTNIRVVWFAVEETFNVSVPYLQFIGLRSQQSRFGQTLVIETSTYAGNFVLGFRIDPDEKLNELYNEISSLWRTWTAKPILGIQVELQDTMAVSMLEDTLDDNEDGDATRTGAAGASSSTSQQTRAWDALVRSSSAAGSGGARGRKERELEGQNVVQEAPSDAFAAYYADEGMKGADRRPVYEPSIGLAVEKLRKGATIQGLWDASVPS